MKIHSMKLAYAIKIGPSEEFFLDSAKFDIELHGNSLVKVIDKRATTKEALSRECWTSLYNVIWFKEDVASEPTKSKK